MQRNIASGAMTSFWWDSGNDGGAGTDITDGETLTLTGTNGINVVRSGNTMTIDGNGTYYAWQLNVNGSFQDGITDLETLGFTAGSGISLIRWY